LLNQQIPILILYFLPLKIGFIVEIYKLAHRFQAKNPASHQSRTRPTTAIGHRPRRGSGPRGTPPQAGAPRSARPPAPGERHNEIRQKQVKLLEPF
jgi:hypothetical protein